MCTNSNQKIPTIKIINGGDGEFKAAYLDRMDLPTATAIEVKQMRGKMGQISITMIANIEAVVKED